MYSTCLFCHAPLGANEAIEHFPVGRRLAFDAEKGRLWVVCKQCGRWNLTPLEERWEAIEECERLFRGTRLRVSTDNIGLAKLRDGLELVCVGRPERSELAAWRYGDVIRRRWRRALVVGSAMTVGGLGAHLAIGASQVLVGPLGAALSMMALQGPKAVRRLLAGRQVLGRIGDDAGRVHEVRGHHVEGVQLEARGTGRWGLIVPTDGGRLHIEGEPAMRAARFILPRLNQAGARPGIVRAAVKELVSAGDVERYFTHVAHRSAENERVDRSYRIAPFGRPWSFDQPLTFLRMQRPAVRLALEMAAHEETERRAMEGELAALEAAWKEAEEIAGIADDLFLPPRVGDFMKTHRRPT